MNNVYFSNEGMTSTTANFYANVAKELQNAASERLNNIKFFSTSVAVIGSKDKQIMSEGNRHLNFIQEDLKYLASLNAFCAWVREAIKEKEEQIKTISRFTMEDWAKSQGIELPTITNYSAESKTFSEKDVLDSWDINKRNKYLKLEAFAATFGKYIHPDGAYSKARKKAHAALNNPITKEGEGRDMVLYYTEESVPINQVDELFMLLQDKYRSFEKELNYMKAEIKDTINNLNREANDQYQKELDEYQARAREYNVAFRELRSQFQTWKTNELEKISKLKIVIPENLKSIFKHIQEISDASK